MGKFVCQLIFVISPALHPQLFRMLGEKGRNYCHAVKLHYTSGGVNIAVEIIPLMGPKLFYDGFC
jgi:hypothetical protein